MTMRPASRSSVLRASFALVERAAGPGDWEAAVQWPQGALAWFEIARYGLLVA
jgi:hypothetical protein